MNHRASLCILACLFTFGLAPQPVAAQSASDTARVVDAIRKNGCQAGPADLDRMLGELNMTQKRVDQVLDALRRNKALEVDRANMRIALSPAYCKGKASMPEPDHALARKVLASEAAMRRHVLALFAANNCRLSYAQFQSYLDDKFPPAYAADMTSDIAKARFLMDAIPALLIRSGDLETTKDKKVLISKGPGCKG